MQGHIIFEIMYVVLSVKASSADKTRKRRGHPVGCRKDKDMKSNKDNSRTRVTIGSRANCDVCKQTMHQT